MSKPSLLTCPHVIRKSLAMVLAGATMLGANARAQTTNTAALPAVVVTGSLIPTAETVGVAPVETVTPAAIERSGAQDVLSLVRKLSASFSGNGNVGQTVNNGGAGEANIAVRNLPTLVLLDGRRLAPSTLSQGSAVDLNTLPLSMIERVEVLKDGASTIYGSDAIGGVVNIITKKNYSGSEVGGRYGFATEGGDIAEESAYVVLGVSTEKTSITGGASWLHSSPVKSVDRFPANLHSDEAYNLGINNVYSSRFPARVDSMVLRGSPLLIDPRFPADPRYMAGVQTPPIVPGGPYYSVADYNAAASRSVEDGGVGFAPYVSLSGVPQRDAAHTSSFFYFPEFTHSVQEQNRDNAWVNFNHQICDKKLEVFGQFLYAHTRSIGSMAPSPVGDLLAEGKLGVPANNPYNPFGIPLGLGGLIDPNSPVYDPNFTEPNVRTRFIEFGPRIFDTQKDYFRFVGGLKGEINEKFNWESAFNYNRSDELQRTLNAVNGSALNQAMQPNFNLAPPPGKPAGYYSQLVDFMGNNVPTYNIFAPQGFNDPATIQAIKTSLFQSGISELYGFDAVINGRPFDLPAGPVAFAVGGGYQYEAIEIDFDGLTKAGQVPGLNPADTLARVMRERWACFAEVSIPLTSPDHNIPAFHSFEINASGRFESLSPGGDSAVPKVGFRWQPLDEQFTIRGTYSQGFIAPSLYTLYAPPQVSNPTIALPTDSTGTDIVGEQMTVQYISNRSLPPSTSENYNIGLVVSPKCVKNLTVSIDYYNISQEGAPYNPDPNVMVADLNAYGSASQYAQFYKRRNGTPLQDTSANQLTTSSFGTLGIPTLPGGAQRTAGLDFGLNYEIPTESAGKFNLFCNANYLLSYDVRLGPDQPFYSYKGQFTDGSVVGGANGVLADYTLAMGLAWEYKDLTASISARYIPSVQDPGTLHPAIGGESNDYTQDGNAWTVSDYFTIDLQVAYRFQSPGKWYDGTRLAVGCNNVTDEQAPVIASAFEDHTDKSSYDILGRFVYFEVSKKF